MARFLTAAELRSAIERGERVQLVDVRDVDEFAAAHIPSAVNIPMEEAESRIDDLQQRDSVVLVCQGGPRAELTCELLAQHHPDLKVLQGGTDAWRAAGLPLVGSRASRLPLMRQVQVVVGPLALVGALLALFVNPLWAILPAIIGAGLTVAGSTGFCGMAKIIGAMPWNRPKVSQPAAAKTTANVELK